MKLKKLLMIACGISIGISSCKKDESNVLKDADGNVYTTVTIGTQTWMVENLKTTKYNDGTPIPNVTDAYSWCLLSSGAQCDYDNNVSNTKTYGKLYNWYAVNTGKLAPKGWHIPTDAEWATLTNYVGGESVAGGVLKTTGTTNWNSPNTAATNSFGFSALPGGFRDNNGDFTYMNVWGVYWTATETNSNYAWRRPISYTYSKIFIDESRKEIGYSVRCIKN